MGMSYQRAFERGEIEHVSITVRWSMDESTERVAERAAEVAAAIRSEHGTTQGPNWRPASYVRIIGEVVYTDAGWKAVRFALTRGGGRRMEYSIRAEFGPPSALSEAADANA